MNFGARQWSLPLTPDPPEGQEAGSPLPDDWSRCPDGENAGRGAVRLKARTCPHLVFHG